jgi:thioredoxin-related protein
MKKENKIIIALFCIAVAIVYSYNNSKFGRLVSLGPDNVSASTDTVSMIAWQTYDEGMRLAKEQDKHILLYFHAEWCTYCRKLDHTTFQDKKVIKYLKENFISISVDSDKNKELTTQWKVRGLPTFHFLEPDSSKISNLPGYVDGKQFLRILNYIHSKSYDKMNFHEFMKTQ